MDIKGKKLTIEEIGKLDNGSKVWIEDCEVNSGYTEIYIKDNKQLTPFSTDDYMNFTFDFEEITVHEWHEDMVEIKGYISPLITDIKIVPIMDGNTLIDIKYYKRKDMKTMKFKVGDRVEMVKKVTGAKIGEQGKIIEVSGTINSIGIEFDKHSVYRHNCGKNGVGITCKMGHGWFANEDEIKLVEEKTMEKQFSKADLRDGMVVISRQNKKYLYVKGAFINSLGYNRMGQFNNDLSNETDSEYDIMKIYYPNDWELVSFLKDGTLVKEANLIWERIETTATDWSKVEKDTLIEIENYGKQFKRYFAKFENDRVYFYPFGASSKTYDGNNDLVDWKVDKTRLYK